MYAVDHIRRVLTTFPGVFTGIGEFTIHQEFVSAKIAGGPPSLLDAALDRIFEIAGEAGPLAINHNDVDTPFPKPDQDVAREKFLKSNYARLFDTARIRFGHGRKKT